MYNRRNDKKFQDTGGFTFQIAHGKQRQREVDLVILSDIKLETLNQISQAPKVGIEKFQCLSSRELPKDSNFIPSAILEGVLSVSNIDA